MRSEGIETFEVYSLELLRRAIAHDDQETWAVFQQCLEETVLTWLHEHPGREAVCRGLCEKDLVVQAFERFRQATQHHQHREFTTFAAALHYLRASLNGAILDTLRAYSRLREVPLPEPGSPGELVMEDGMGSGARWENLQEILPDVRERRLAYLLFHCGLTPRQIVRFCPQDFNDVDEISHLRLTVMERQLHHADHLRR
jgi:hypothetical protein